MNIERITSRQNPLMIHVKKLLSSRSYREKNQQFAGDGVKLLQEAIRWDTGVETVIMTEGAVDFELPGHLRLVEVPKELMAHISQMDAPQGAIFICRIPHQTEIKIQSPGLVLDGIQDPGNVGTILRTADALDISVVLSDGCADPYNPKTVRASMGAILRNPPVSAKKEDILSYCKEHDIPIFATALSDRAVDIRQVRMDGAVVIGSEGKGVSKEFLDAADKEIIIPMNPKCESLNAAVAATIVMWEMK